RGVETREHVADILAVHASIQNSELVPRETADQFFRKAARITGGRRAGTRATGRRRSERHNLDRQAAHEKPRGPRKWEIKADLIGRHRARSRMGGSGSGGWRWRPRCGALWPLLAAPPVPGRLPIGSASQWPRARPRGANASVDA